jgi:hypothetical protein
MTEQSTLVVVHYDRENGSLREFAAKATAASKGHSSPQRFLTYAPVHGPRNVAYVWFPHDSHAELEPGGHASPLASNMGQEAASTLAREAGAGVKGVGGALIRRTLPHGSEKGAPPKYVMAYSVRFDPEKTDELRDGVRKLAEANRSSGKPLHVSIHRAASGRAGERLVLVGLDSLKDLDRDGHANHPRAIDHLGPEVAVQVGQRVARGVKAVHKQILRYVPEYSHA